MQRYVNMINYDYIYDYKLCTVDRIQRCSTDNSWSWFSYDQGEMASWNDHVLFYQSGGCMQEIEVTAFSRSIPEVSDPVHRDFYFSSRRILAFLLLPFSKMFERNCAISLFGCIFSTTSSLILLRHAEFFRINKDPLDLMCGPCCFNQTFRWWAEGPIDWSGVSGRMLFGCSTVTWCCNFKPKFTDWHWRNEQVCSELANTLAPQSLFF